MPKGTASQEMVAKVLHTAVAQGAGTVNGTGIDCRGYDEALIVLSLGIIPSNGTVDVKIQESSDNGVADTFADVSGAAFAQKVAGTGTLTYVGRINLRGRERYLRTVVVVANQTVPMAVTAILSQAQINPVTQVNTVGFNV